MNIDFVTMEFLKCDRTYYVSELNNGLVHSVSLTHLSEKQQLRCNFTLFQNHSETYASEIRDSCFNPPRYDRSETIAISLGRLNKCCEKLHFINNSNCYTDEPLGDWKKNCNPKSFFDIILEFFYYYPKRSFDRVRESVLDFLYYYLHGTFRHSLLVEEERIRLQMKRFGDEEIRR